MLRRVLPIVAITGFAVQHSYCAFDKNCEVPACASKVDQFKKAMQMHANENKTKGGTSSNSEAKTETNQSQQHVVTQAPTGKKPKILCPLDRDELGKSAWDLIHTVAAFYPEDPSEEDKQSAISFISSLAHLYPCKVCAKDFQDSVKAIPPKVANREEFSMYCCELHNEVNRKLNKPVYPCALKDLDKRWRDGPECWNQLYEESKEEENQ